MEAEQLCAPLPAMKMERPLASLEDIPLQISVRLGTTQLPLGELLNLRPGALVTLDQNVEEPAEIMVSGRTIGRGQVVRVGEALGIRVSEVSGTLGLEQ